MVSIRCIVEPAITVLETFTVLVLTPSKMHTKFSVLLEMASSN